MMLHGVIGCDYINTSHTTTEMVCCTHQQKGYMQEKQQWLVSPPLQVDPPA